MTDTITTEVVDTTITNLREALTKAEERLTTEAEEYVAKRDRMVLVAHRRGTANSIGSALDDLLEEFDLPRRGEAVTMFGLLMVSEPIDQSQTAGFYTSGNNYVYTQPGTRASWPVAMEMATNVQPGRTCACDRGMEEVMRQYLTEYFGATRARNMHFQIGETNCGASMGCINGDRRRYDTSRDYGIDWSTKPVIVHTPPDPAEVEDMTRDPRIGETWYLRDANTFGASNVANEPVIITSTRSGGEYNVRRTTDADGYSRWYFRREHLRATPSA